MIIASTVFLLLFCVLSTIDGLYFHLYKYKLHTSNRTLEEHLTHSIRALLFGPIIYLLYAVNAAGYFLWLAIFLVVADLAVETWDVLVERKSRAHLGGLSTAEYWVHINATTLRVAAIALALAGKPLSAWKLQNLPFMDPYPRVVVLVALVLIACSVLTAIQHFWYLRRFRWNFK